MPLTLVALPLVLAAAVEYPLAKQFIAAHPSNYVVGALNDPQYVIIHQQDGYYEGTISWFQYAGSNVSTHYVMRSIDGEITQMVPHADMAQHIGGYNPYSFGIEHEGFMFEPGWYPWETYTASAQLTRWLCDAYAIPIDRDHIVGHVEVPGATHTDPGPYWNWDMYMALVHDVVPQGRVQGVLVDRSAPCVLTALEDTWITTTLETLDALDDDEMCFVPAGTELAYLHASDEMISQHRLTMEGGGPCAGIGTLDEQAYIWAPAFSPVCPAEDLAVTEGVTVQLGDAIATIDAAGRFAFDDVPAGAHVIDVTSDGTWTPTSVPIDLAIYPGSRVVIALDPADAARPEDPDRPPADDSGSDGAAGTTTDRPGHSSSTSPAEPTTDSGDDVQGTHHTDAEAGCGCRQRAPRRGSIALFVLTVASFTRARRRARPARDRRP